MLILLISRALAATIEVGPDDDVWAAAAVLAPGDELVLRAGTYSTSSGSSWYRALLLEGTADAPIVIRAAEGAEVIIAGDPEGSQNTLNLSGSHWELRDLIFRHGSHGVRLGTSAFGTLENVEISDTHDVGLSMNRSGETYDHMTVRGCHIHHTAGTGEGMYLGCNDGACVVSNAIIEFNQIHDTADSSQGDGIELKAGSYGNILRHNVIWSTHYPGITLYGTYGGAPNEVYGNVIWDTIDNGIQAVGEARVHDNLVFQAGGYGIYAKSSQGSIPEDLIIAHNTVVDAGAGCLRVNDLDQGGEGVVVANNLLSCADTWGIRLGSGEGAALFRANAVLGEVAVSGQIALAGEILDGPLSGWPVDGAAIGGAADPAWVTAVDFDCVPRKDADIGAYAWTEGGAPQWTVTEGFKASCGDDPPEDPEDPDDTGEPLEEDTADSDTGDASDPDPDSDSDPDPTSGESSAKSSCGCGGGGTGVGLGALLVLGLGLLRRRARRPLAISAPGG